MFLDFLKFLLISFTLTLCMVEGLPQNVANTFASTPSSSSNEAIRYQKALTMENYLNLSVNPCDDFYEFACGGWKKYYPATSALVETNPITLRDAEAKSDMLHFMNSYNANETKVDRKVKDFYHSCMNLPYLSPTVHSYKLREIIKEFGEMPALEGATWKGMRYGWSETISKIYAKYGISILLNPEWHSEKYTQLTHPDFIIETLQHYQDPYIQTFRSYILRTVKRTLVNLLNIDHATADRVANEIADVEIALARAASKDTVLEFISPDDVEVKYNSTLNIRKYLRAVLGRLPKQVIENKSYLDQLSKVVTSTPEHMLANYIFYNLIRPFNIEMPTELEKRESKCLGVVKTYFKDFYHNILYRQHDISQVETGLTNLFYDIKNIFKSNFNSPKYDWIKRSSRRQAVEKLEDMKLVIVNYADVNFDSKYSVEINNTDYVESLKSVLRLKALLNLNPREHKVDSKVENLMYIATSNNVYVNVAQLKPEHFWSPAYPNAVNFGSLGFYLAHEVAHGFDLGSLTDEFTYPFDSKSLAGLEERVQCLKGQFEKYTYYGKQLTPLKSQDENIADVVGMALIYDVYTSWLNNPFRPQQGPSEQLPPLIYTPEQLFFISFAQSTCSDLREEYRLLSADNHSPSTLRVRSSLANLEQFAKAFKCPRGSQMNPMSRCEIY